MNGKDGTNRNLVISAEWYLHTSLIFTDIDKIPDTKEKLLKQFMQGERKVMMEERDYYINNDHITIFYHDNTSINQRTCKTFHSLKELNKWLNTPVYIPNPPKKSDIVSIETEFDFEELPRGQVKTTKKELKSLLDDISDGIIKRMQTYIKDSIVQICVRLKDDKTYIFTEMDYFEKWYNSLEGSENDEN